MAMGDTVSWEAFEQKGNYHFGDISDIAMNGALAAQRFFRKIVEEVSTKSLIEDDFPADNLLHRDGKYLRLHDKGTINLIADEDRDYIEEIRRIVDPYGDDEEMERLCDA